MRIPAGIWLAALLAAGGAMAELPKGAVPMDLISAPSLSPDGNSMVFAWMEDIWTASTDSGEAIRIVEHDAHEAHPHFTPDGKRIVFSSDRTGRMQVYSTPSKGGEIIRHTHHSGGSQLECISPDSREALVRGTREASGSRSARLMRISLDEDRRERRLFNAPGHSAAWSPDGKSILFCQRGEQSFRKGYTGSRASRIWLYQLADHRFEAVANGDSEAGSPLWKPDSRGFYFASNRDGTANLWQQEIGGKPVRVTHYQGDGVLMPEISADGGTLIFRRGLGVFRFRPAIDPEPAPITPWTREALIDVSTETRKFNGAVSADFTNDLQQVVFAAGGELWALAKPDSKPVRLTNTPAAEGGVAFSPSGEWLYFLRDDGIEANYFRARFDKGALFDEMPVTRGTPSKSRLKICPDGMKIAWLEGNGDVFTAEPDGSQAQRVFECWDKPTYDWSPDGRWLVVAAENRDSNRDIWLADATGGGNAVNLTEHPAFEGSPHWSPDGRWIIFNAKRDESGETRLWKIDLGASGLTEMPDATAARALGDTAEMVGTRGIEPIRVIWSPDSESVWFQSRLKSSDKLYRVGIDGKNMTPLTEQRGIPIRITPDGTLLWRIGQTPETWKDGKSTRFPISLTLTRNRANLQQLGFRRIWRALGERFYDPEMNGNDWPALRSKYESAATHARSSRQFDRVISLLIGELNASHLTFQRRPWSGEKFKPNAQEPTAHPGWIFQDDEADPNAPLVIKHVIKGSPTSLLDNGARAGDTVLRIAGEAVSNGTPLFRFFNGAENRPLPVILRGIDGRERTIGLRCISQSKARFLYQKERHAAAVAKTSSPDAGIAYLKVPDMSRKSFDALALEVYRASQTGKGIILDFRDNAGGREADRMLGLFCQPVHSFTVPRDGPAGYPIDRRPSPAWNGPLVVLCNQNTYSNAEIFCHAVKQIGRAPLIGIATAGGVISAVSETISDVGKVQVPFRGWYQTGTRRNLDLNGAKPDFPVDLTPKDEDAGSDPQLDKAIEVIREMIS